MKVKAYMRVARNDEGRTRHKLAAGVSPNLRPLEDARGYALPTVSFAVELDVPDALFERAADVIATVSIPEESARIAADVVAGETTG